MKHNDYYTCDVCGKKIKYPYAPFGYDVSMSSDTAGFAHFLDMCSSCTKKIMPTAMKLYREHVEKYIYEQRGKIKKCQKS